MLEEAEIGSEELGVQAFVVEGEHVGALDDGAVAIDAQQLAVELREGPRRLRGVHQGIHDVGQAFVGVELAVPRGGQERRVGDRAAQQQREFRGELVAGQALAPAPQFHPIDEVGRLQHRFDDELHAVDERVTAVDQVGCRREQRGEPRHLVGAERPTERA